MKHVRKKNTKKILRSDEVFVVDKDVRIRAPGLKGLPSTDDEAETKEGLGDDGRSTFQNRQLLIVNLSSVNADSQPDNLTDN